MDDPPERMRAPFLELLGLRLVEAGGERVVATLPVTPKLHQNAGIVHGGVYAAMVETATSVGAYLFLQGRGAVVGVSNHTDFLRAVRDGELRVEATPLQRGRTMQLWEARVTDEQDRLVAHGRVRLMNLPEEPSQARERPSA